MKTTILVFSADDSSLEWPPSGANEFIAWLEEKIDTVPVGHRHDVVIEISSERGYGDDDTTAKITLFYRRDETSEEHAARLAKETNAAQSQINYEKVLLAQLLRKHGMPE